MDPPPFDNTASSGSLPAAEELRTQMALDNSSPSHKNRKKWYLASALAVVLVLVVVIAVMVPGKGDDSIEKAKAGFSPEMLAAEEFLSYISDEADLTNPSKPQYMALDWLVNRDPTNMSVPESRDYGVSFQYIQRYIVAVFYYATNGANWKQNTNFLSGKDVCEWRFDLPVEIEGPSGTTQYLMGIDCNDVGEVNYIFLPDNGLDGTLSHELGFLVAMEHLSLYKNDISGPFPDSFTFLEDLQFIAMEANLLTGTMPAFFTKYSKLEYLALGMNNLEGSLPPLGGMTSLKEISLDNNMFTGSLDAFIGCGNLTTLFVQDNQLDFVLGDDFLPGTPLDIIDLSDNRVSGNFPAEFYEYSIVDVHNNTLTGPLPEIDRPNYPIEYLSVYRNDMTGQLPVVLGGLRQLTHLDVSLNDFTGSFPDSINEMTKLQYLFMASNPFDEGDFPAIWNLNNLVEISMKKTRRNSQIPSYLGDFEDLVLLDLDDNSFTGQIPTELGRLSNLRFLLLNRNELTGPVPIQFDRLESLALFMADRNSLTGNADHVCNSNAPIEYMILDCAGEDGQVPEISCSTDCCTKCCRDSDTNCNRAGLLANLDDSYVRDQYVFSEDIVFKFKAQAAN